MDQGKFQKASLFLLIQFFLISCRQAPEITSIVKDDKDITDILFLWSQLYFPTSEGVEPQCREDSEKYRNGVVSSPWALEMLDSSGKFPDGIAIGNHYILGSYEQCVRIGTENDDYTAPFRGRYCKGRIRFRIEGEYSSDEMTLARILSNFLDREENIGGSALGAIGYYGLYWGVCIPESCTHRDISNHTNHVLTTISQMLVTDTANLTLYSSGFTDDTCFTDDPAPVSFDTVDIVFTSIMSTIAAIILVSTLVDMWALYGDFWCSRESQQESLNKTPGGKVLAAFSLYRNGKKILATGGGGSRSITCLHGIRFISMTWVIYGHGNVHLFGNNTVGGTVYDYTKNVALQIMFNAYLSVDTFFYLSGFLVAYSILPALDKIKERAATHLSPPLTTPHPCQILPPIYLHRYLRLTPAYLAVIGFCATIRGKFMVWAPASPYSTQDCRKAWWKLILYIHTLFDGTVYEEEDYWCMGQGWYLSVDMQIFLMAPPLILLAWYLPPRHRNILMGLVTFIFMLIPGIITWVYDYAPTDVWQQEKNPDAPDQHDTIYKKPWSRATPYLIGIWLAIWIHDRKGKKLRLSPLVVAVGWLTALAVGLSIEYGMYPYNQPGPATYSTFTAVAYATLHRPAWAMCLSWVVVTCHHGYGGPINALLSWSAFVPLSKLTYCAYLIHLVVLDFFWDNTRVMYKDQLLNSWVFISTVAVSLAFAFILALLVEVPALNLDKILMDFLTGNKKAKEVHKKQKGEVAMEKGGVVNDNFVKN